MAVPCLEAQLASRRTGHLKYTIHHGMAITTSIIPTSQAVQRNRLSTPDAFPYINLHRPSPINLHIDPSHKSRLIRRKEKTRRRDIRRFAEPTNGHVRQELCPVFRRVGDPREGLEPAGKATH